MNLILLSENDFISPDTVSFSGHRCEHLRNVLRAGQGGRVKVGLLNGMLGKGEVVELNEDNVKLRIELADWPPEPLPLTLICALPRPKTLKKVLQALVAYGVKKIYFIETWKVEKSYWGSPLLEQDALKEQIMLGLEQAGDTVMPEIHFRRRFKPFVEDELSAIVGDSLGITAHPAAERTCPVQPGKPVTLCIGPEGGFTGYEVQLLEQHGCTAVRLGTRPLRTEFAVCALLGRLF